ncbi:MAG: RcnB family protein [Polaromonas sp.]
MSDPVVAVINHVANNAAPKDVRARNRNAPHSRPRDFDRHDARSDRNYGARGPHFHRCGRIPAEYRSRQYVVNKWHAHHLNAPPRGQRWVQVGSDYALIAIATGVIAQLILSQ